jgi:hypothetical protein
VWALHRARSIASLACALGLAACVADGDGDPAGLAVEDAEAVTEQGISSLVFVLRSVSVPDQVVDPLIAQPGQLVRLGPASITSQQRWRFSDGQLHYNAQPGLCLSPEVGAAGARLLLRPCSASPGDQLQQWRGELHGADGVSWRNELTELWMDASAGAFGVLRLQPRIFNAAQQAFRMTGQ